MAGNGPWPTTPARTGTGPVTRVLRSSANEWGRRDHSEDWGRHPRTPCLMRHRCRYGSSPAAHRLVVPALSFPSDRKPSLSHRSRLASFYTRTDQPQHIDAIGPDLRSVHAATSRAALSSCARCRTIALSRPPAPAQDCPGSCCAPPHATASDRTPCRRMFAKRHREDRIDVSFHSGSAACEDRDGACPFGGSSTPVTGPARRWPPSQLWVESECNAVA